MMDPSNLIQDEIETSKALQHWLGIAYHITDDEGIITVRESIKREFDAGLPKQILTDEANNLTYKDILKKSTKFQKDWFLLVRTIREKQEQHQIKDEFHHPGALRDWIGLDN